MKQKIRAKLRSFIFEDIENQTYFYDKFQGGRKLSFFKKLLIILLDLQTFKDFVLFHNNPFVLRTFGKSTQKTKTELSMVEEGILEKLKRDGIVFLDGYFENSADNLISANVSEKDSTSNNYITNNEIIQNDELFNILNDTSLINVASEYYGTQAYYRFRPIVNLTNPKRNEINSRQKASQVVSDNFADDWHVDSIYNLQYHILLKDVSPNGTRMLFAKGPKVKFFERFCGYASDEYIKDNYSIIDCVGKKGTVVLFDGSLYWHKLLPIKGSKRVTSSVLFTRGQQVVSNDEYSKSLNLEKISKEAITTTRFIT